LCATELITNAVEAGCQSATLHVILDDRLRLSIMDDADGMPTTAQPLPSAIRGRGLVIVEALSDRWGVDRTAAGKEVWAEFALP
jgi:two-component sensor histidine kinase